MNTEPLPSTATAARPVADSSPRPQETALAFACGDEQLLGILSLPHASVVASGTAVLIIVGGPQYRAGSHRQFVQLARALAAAGHPSLRFDVRGMGDSTGDQRSFEAVSDDIGAAVDILCGRAAVTRVVLFGLCDAASAALLYLHQRPDSRVGGLCLLNPWFRSEQSLAQTQVKHYYRQRLLSADFWRKLASGRVGFGAVQSLLSVLKTARPLTRGGPGAGTGPRALDFRAAMLAGWAGFAGPSLLVLSGADLTAMEFVQATAHQPSWKDLLARPSIRRIELPEADHTLSDTASRQTLEAAVVDWLGHHPVDAA